VIEWLGDLPAGLIFVLFAVIAIGITVLFDVLMRKLVAPETRQRASATASVTLQVTATIYAILIAFVIVDAYSQVRDAQGQISDKASNLAIVYENSRDLPEAPGDDTRRATLAYARAVVRRGIPRLEDTQQPDGSTDHALERMFRTVQRYEPKSESERAAYDNLVRALDGIVATRAQLLDSARATIPNTLIALLVVIALVVMAVATLLDTRHRRSHIFILSALGLVIWLTIALVISLDYPFSGLIRVTDDPIRQFISFRAAR
jgi:NADH:ubiquinone oxidoreductase subunit 6 (subunit J)